MKTLTVCTLQFFWCLILFLWIFPASAMEWNLIPGIQMQQMAPMPQPRYQGQYYDTGRGSGYYQDNRGQQCQTFMVGGSVQVVCQ